MMKITWKRLWLTLNRIIIVTWACLVFIWSYSWIIEYRTDKSSERIIVSLIHKWILWPLGIHPGISAWERMVYYASEILPITILLTIALFCINIVPRLLSTVINMASEPYPGYCGRCGYNLTGNVSGICPECGVQVGTEPLIKINRGLLYQGLAWGLPLLLSLLAAFIQDINPTRGLSLLQVLGVICGLASVVIGLAPLARDDVSEWTREHIVIAITLSGGGFLTFFWNISHHGLY